MPTRWSQARDSAESVLASLHTRPPASMKQARDQRDYLDFLQHELECMRLSKLLQSPAPLAATPAPTAAVTGVATLASLHARATRLAYDRQALMIDSDWADDPIIDTVATNNIGTHTSTASVTDALSDEDRIKMSIESRFRAIDAELPAALHSVSTHAATTTKSSNYIKTMSAASVKARPASTKSTIRASAAQSLPSTTTATHHHTEIKDSNTSTGAPSVSFSSALPSATEADFPFLRHLASLFSAKPVYYLPAQPPPLVTAAMLPMPQPVQPPQVTLVAQPVPPLPQSQPVVHISPALMLPPPVLNVKHTPVFVNDSLYQPLAPSVANPMTRSWMDASVATTDSDSHVNESSITRDASTDTHVPLLQQQNEVALPARPTKLVRSQGTETEAKAPEPVPAKPPSPVAVVAPAIAVAEPAARTMRASHSAPPPVPVPAFNSHSTNTPIINATDSDASLLDLVLRAFDLADDSGVESEWRARLQVEDERQRQRRTELEAHAAEARAYQREIEERERKQREMMDEERRKQQQRLEDEKRMAELVEAKVQERLALLERRRELEMIALERERAKEIEAEALRLKQRESELESRSKEADEARQKNRALQSANAELEARLLRERIEAEAVELARLRAMEEEKRARSDAELARSLAEQRAEAERIRESQTSTAAAMVKLEHERQQFLAEQKRLEVERERAIINEMKVEVHRLKTERREIERDIAEEIEVQRQKQNSMPVNDGGGGDDRPRTGTSAVSAVSNDESSVSASSSSDEPLSDDDVDSELNVSQSSINHHHHHHYPQHHHHHHERRGSLGEISLSRFNLRSPGAVPTPVVSAPPSPGQMDWRTLSMSGRTTQPQTYQRIERPPLRTSARHARVPVHRTRSAAVSQSLMSSHHSELEESFNDLSDGELTMSGRHMFVAGKLVQLNKSS